MINTSKLINLVGKKFGKLLVLERADNNVSPCGMSHVMWKCHCDCGSETIVLGNNLKKRFVKSCGCLKKETITHLTHGKTNTRLYHTWSSMKQRCYCTKTRSYKTYGAEGITVCEEWKNDFQTFYEWAMDNGYKEDLTIDRIDNDKGYYPDNCKWATREEQNINKRNNLLITYNGKTQALSRWAIEYKINYWTLRSRLYRDNWKIEKALTF